MVIGTYSGSVTATKLTVHKCDGERKESVSVSGSFGVQYIVHTRGKLEQVMVRLPGVCSDFP